MHYSAYIAKRFLKTQKSQSQKFISFITAFAVTGVTLGVTALIITLTILVGFEHELTRKVFSFTAHVQITTFQNKPIEEYQKIINTISRTHNDVVSISPVVSKEGMISYHDQADGVLIKGISSANEVDIAKYLVEGKILLNEYSDGVYDCVIGRKLLSRLGASINDTLLAFGIPSEFSATVQPRIAGLIVKGVYESGMAEYDDVYLYTSIHAAQDIFDMPDAVSGLDIMLNNPENANHFAKNISAELGFPFFGRSIYQQYRNLFTWIQLQKEPIPLVLGLITLVAAINIIGTLLMLILEKKKQIGILRSLGSSAKDIRKIFLRQGLIISIIGTVLGNFIGFSVCWLQQTFHFFSLPSTIYFMSTVPILFKSENFIIVTAVSIILCLTASYIPAKLASNLDPIKAIRQ
ncbi:MAG: ABC transporter permease [Bacteroidetes bacterium]|nr:ABC transporter permease [Bacteroidota bacterium]